MNSDLLPLIDCDVLCYRCGFAADGQMKREAQAAEPGAGDDRIAEMLESVDYQYIAFQNVKTVMDAVVAKFNGNYKAFIQGKGNFREELATLQEYKGSRKGKPKPKYFNEIRQYLINVWKAEVVDGQESDDALGIYQCSQPYGTTVIVSNDKDMDMIPGWHYNWVKEELYEVRPDEADMMLFWQVLQGDSTDDIPGIRGVGPATATKLLAPCKDAMEAQRVVTDAYTKEYGDNAQARLHEVANLLWIRREENQACPLI